MHREEVMSYPWFQHKACVLDTHNTFICFILCQNECTYFQLNKRKHARRPARALQKIIQIVQLQGSLEAFDMKYILDFFFWKIEGLT